MIKFEELKPGNLVKCKVSNDAGIYKVEKLDAWMRQIGLDGARRGELYNEDKLRPIPLSEDILLKCGFKERNDEVECKISNFLKLGYDEGVITLVYDIEYLPLDIKYLHQLQNFYYSLTGEELPINL